MKKITRKHRDAITWAGLNPDNWLIKKHVDGELLIVNKTSKKERTIPS